ncbi:NIPSNAP family protein [Microlunatus speluncae]|uniref:NIPSNAP family protein n=1 Tax=Microlunatus speluncae TaxID=2594267 RepID=UPI00126635F6|nr:NIPSNAP family protein [Microlunatus speluncae]
MSSTAPTATECGVVELRRYLLRPGGRDALIELFEREFVESQEVLGMHLFGLFREEGADDHFVWFRGFRDLGERLTALQTFYSGPVWARHGAAANATMISTDDVLLLRPTQLYASEPPGRDGSDRPPLEVAVSDLRGRSDADRTALGDPAMPPGFRPLGRFETLPAENDFPGLPVRDADVVVIIGTGAPAPGGEGVVRHRLLPTARSRWP